MHLRNGNIVVLKYNYCKIKKSLAIYIFGCVPFVNLLHSYMRNILFANTTILGLSTHKVDIIILIFLNVTSVMMHFQMLWLWKSTRRQNICAIYFCANTVCKVCPHTKFTLDTTNVIYVKTYWSYQLEQPYEETPQS